MSAGARPGSDWEPTASLETLARRHQALRAIRAFFDAEGFIEVETPALVPNPGLELHLDALEVVGMGAARYLHTSPEYHMKRLLGAAMPRIYQVGKAFRRGELGAQHQPEFTMLEWYRAPGGEADMMRDTERLVAHVALELTSGTILPGVERAVDVAPPWERLSVREAFLRYAGVSADALARDDEETFYRTLVERVEPELGRGKPTFLTRYPASQAALARLWADDPSVAERFEAYVDGVELCNGFGELTDVREQRARFEADCAARIRLGRASYPLDERMLAALERVPPSGGNALGVDRLLMLALGIPDIAEVVAFSAERA